MALLVAVSVAVLPFAGGAAVSIEPAELAVAESTHDCCDPGSSCDETSKTVNGCASMAACAVKCFTYAGTVLPHVAIVRIGSSVHPIRDSGLVVSQIANPPFRPPRV